MRFTAFNASYPLLPSQERSHTEGTEGIGGRLVVNAERRIRKRPPGGGLFGRSNEGAVSLGSGALDGGHFAGGQALGGFLDFKGDLLAFGPGLETRTADRGKMDEHVLAAIIGGNETKTLALVEPLHNTSIHNL